MPYLLHPYYVWIVGIEGGMEWLILMELKKCVWLFHLHGMDHSCQIDGFHSLGGCGMTCSIPFVILFPSLFRFYLNSIPLLYFFQQPSYSSFPFLLSPFLTTASMFFWRLMTDDDDEIGSWRWQK